MKNKRWFALALALCMLLPLAACSLKPAAPWPTLREGDGCLRQGRSLVRGNGDVSHETDINEHMRGQEWTLRIELPRVTSSVGKIVIDESLDFAGKLETDSNIRGAGLTRSYNLDRREIVLRGRENQWYAPTVLNFTVGVPVNKIIVNGAVEIDYSCPSVTEMSININGASTGRFAFGALESLRMEVNGAGDITLAGTAKLADMTLNGAGSVKAFDLTAVGAGVTINGAGGCEITATGTLDAEINGVGKVVYDGEPAVSRRIHGLGEVRAR